MFLLKRIKMKNAELDDLGIFGEDVYVKNRILIKKGSILNWGTTSLLKKHPMEMVFIHPNGIERYLGELPDYLLFSEAEQCLDFLHALIQFTSDIRYGDAADQKTVEINQTYSSSFDCFIKICLQIDVILQVMKEKEMVEEIQLKEVNEKLIGLVRQEIDHLRKDSDKSETMILLVEKEHRTSFYVQLLEGLLLTNDVYPFLLDNDINENELVQIANYCNASSICVIGEAYEPFHRKDCKMELFHIRQHQIDNFVKSFVGNADLDIDIKQMLKAYKAVKKDCGTIIGER